MDLLLGWYPGLGEVETIRRMSPLVREFISDACREDDDFLRGYLLPVLEKPDPEQRIIQDIQVALCALEFDEAGLGDVGDIGNLGKSFLKKVKKAVKKVHEKVQKAILPKSVKKIVDKVEEKVSKAVTKAGQSVRETGKKVWKKYGNIIIGAVGLVLAPFTAGASLAAASVLTAANSAYSKKRAADQAKRAARSDAAQLTAAADQERVAAERQLDAFYAQNQQWFVDNLELTPDKWAQLTFEQKVDILQNGMSGRVPGNAPAPEPQVEMPQMPAPQQPPAGGAPSGGGYAPSPSGGGGGGLYPEGSSPGGSTAPYGASQQQKVATAGMFDGAMLPVLAAGAALALIFGKPAGKGRRARRNPRRSRRRAA